MSHAERTRHRAIAAGIALVLLIAAVFVLTRTAPSAPGAPGAPAAPRAKPNVVVIMSDDQTLESLRVMATTRSVIGDAGATFNHFYASFPNCCPSRATYYTGQFSHNNGVRDNVAPHGGVKKLRDDNTLPVWLQQAGYYTAHIGKYLNGSGADGDLTPPPGWSHWFGLIDPSTYHYFNYDVSVNGKAQHFGTDDKDYSTDVLGAEAVRTIGAAKDSGKPFFLSFTPLAPHIQSPESANGVPRGVTWPVPVPAPRHAGMFKTEPLPKTASWNEPRGPGKPDFIQQMKPLTAGDERIATDAYRLELESLQATDEWIGKIVQSLKDQGVYDNTYVLFTSDNGYYHGEHRIPYGKLYLYEAAVHLPLLISGPGIPKGVKVDAPAGNVDLAVTIAKLAGATPGLVVDGRDVIPLTKDPQLGKGRAMLLENTKAGKTLTEAVHTERYFYAESSDGTKELYDLAVDPDQIKNISGTGLYEPVETSLRERLARQRVCAGATCEGSDASDGVIPKTVDLAVPKPDPSTAPPAGSTPDATVQANVFNAMDALTPVFDLTEPEKTCVTQALGLRAAAIGTDGRPVLQDPRALVNAIAIARPCVGPVRRARGLATVAPLLTDGIIAGDLAICLGTAMGKLEDPAFTAAVDFLATINEPDPEARDAMSKMIVACNADPVKILPQR